MGVWPGLKQPGDFQLSARAASAQAAGTENMKQTESALKCASKEAKGKPELVSNSPLALQRRAVGGEG